MALVPQGLLSSLFSQCCQYSSSRQRGTCKLVYLHDELLFTYPATYCRILLFQSKHCIIIISPRGLYMLTSLLIWMACGFIRVSGNIAQIKQAFENELFA